MAASLCTASVRKGKSDAEQSKLQRVHFDNQGVHVKQRIEQRRRRVEQLPIRLRRPRRPLLLNLFNFDQGHGEPARPLLFISHSPPVLHNRHRLAVRPSRRVCEVATPTERFKPSAIRPKRTLKRRIPCGHAHALRAVDMDRSITLERHRVRRPAETPDRPWQRDASNALVHRKFRSHLDMRRIVDGTRDDAEGLGDRLPLWRRRVVDFDCDCTHAILMQRELEANCGIRGLVVHQVGCHAVVRGRARKEPACREGLARDVPNNLPLVI